MTDWQGYLRDNHDRFLEELIEYLRIPSVSSTSENSEDVGRAAQWVTKRFGRAGIENVEIMPTGGHPVEPCQSAATSATFSASILSTLRLHWRTRIFTPLTSSSALRVSGADNGPMSC